MLTLLFEMRTCSDSDYKNKIIPEPQIRYNLKNLNTNFLNNIEFDCKLNYLKSMAENIMNQNELNYVYDSFVNMIVAEMQSIIKIHNISKNNIYTYKKQQSFWNETLDNMWKNMRKHEYNCKKNKNGPHKHLHWYYFKNSQFIFDKEFRKVQRKHKREKMAIIETLNVKNPHEFWQYFKKLGPVKHKDIPLEVIDTQGNLVTNLNLVFEKWKNDFQELYNFRTDVKFNDKFLEIATHYIKCKEEQMSDPLFEDDETLSCNIQTCEIKAAISKTKCGKAAGIDNIPYEIFKHGDVYLVLLKLVQICFDLSLVPNKWSMGVITPIPKSNSQDMRIPLNFRGISLLCTSAKLYSSILNKRLMTYLEEKVLLVDEQNGF